MASYMIDWQKALAALQSFHETIGGTRSVPGSGAYQIRDNTLNGRSGAEWIVLNLSIGTLSTPFVWVGLFWEDFAREGYVQWEYSNTPRKTASGVLFWASAMFRYPQTKKRAKGVWLPTGPAGEENRMRLRVPHQ